MPASPIIEIKNLSAGYDNRTVLHDINLTIYERDFLGIIGPNGGGKTTLIKCILGLLKPTAGEILYHTDSPSPEVAGSQCLPLNTRLSMGYLPQYSSIDRKFPITVEEVILSGLSSQEATCFALQYPTPGERPLPCDSPHGTGRHGTTRHRCLERRTVATRLAGTCHHLRPTGRDS